MVEKTDGLQVGVYTNTPSGVEEVGSFSPQYNEATIGRMLGSSHGGLYGGSGSSVPHQRSITP